MLRLFVAVDLPGEIQSGVEALMRDVHNARWVNPRQLHITLRFFGDTPEDALPTIREALARVRQDSFHLQLHGPGVFPESHGRAPRMPPRVLWLAIEPADALASLRRQIDAALGTGPAQEKQPFSPHLTLARFPRPPDRTLSDFLTRNQDHRSPQWSVTSFRLYQSTLRKEGALHAIVADYPLR